MPVNADQFAVTPYTSTVPLVQIPPDAISGQTRPDQPLQGQFGRKGTSALAIGDSLLKGFMLGHQQKEQRKYAEAQAGIGAAQAAEKSAWENYQSKLSSGEAKNDAKDPYYTAYLAAHNAATETMKKYTIPEKTKSTPKEGSKKALKTDKDPVKSPDDQTSKPQSFGEKLKGVLAANPHLFPQIALAMRNPNPPGMTPQAQVQSLELQTAQSQNQEQQQKVNDRNMLAMYGKMTEEEIKKLPPEVQKQIADPQNGLATAKARYAMENRDKAKPDWFVDESGNFHQVAVGEEPPPGWKKYEKTPTNESQSNMYYDAAARALGTTRDKLSLAQLGYVDAMRARSKAQSSGQTTYSYTTTDVNGDHHTVTKRVSDPVPVPAGTKPLPDSMFQDGLPPPPVAAGKASVTPGGTPKPPTASAAPRGQGTQGIGKPPQAGKTAQTSARGGITPPPGGKQTALTASVTRQAVQKQQEGYQKAETAYTKTIEAADKAFAAAQAKAAQTGDQSILITAQAVKDRDYAQAVIDREKAKVRVAKEYDTAVKSIGGDPTPVNRDSADNPPPGASARVKDANGKLIGYAVNGQFVPLGQ